MNEYEIGSYVVCPGHGVGQIVDIQDREIGPSTKTYFIIKVIANGMTVMVPTDNENGIRGLSKELEIDNLFDFLKDHEVDLDMSTWNRRQRDYLLKLKTGELLEIADVLKSLFLLKEKKKLSFGEKKMLDQCQSLIVQEINLAQGTSIKDVQEKITACF